MFPRKKFVGLLLGTVLLLLMNGRTWAKPDQATKYLQRSASLTGTTGWINVPSPVVPGSGHLSAGVHLNQAKINLGLWEFLEAGIYFEADKIGERFEPNRDLSSWEKAEVNIPAFLRDAFRGQAKLKVLDEEWAGVSLAGGIVEQDYYVVAQRFWSGLSKVTLLAGWGTGRFQEGFAGLSKTLFPGAEIMFEYDGQGINVGLRFLLAPNLIMNVAGLKLDSVGEVQTLGEVISDHVLFGLTYVEPLW